MPLLDVLNESALILCRRMDEYVRIVNCATSPFLSCLAFRPGWPWRRRFSCHNFLRCQTDQVRISTKEDTAIAPKGEIFAAKKMINCTTRLSKNVYNASALVALCLFVTLRQVSKRCRYFECCLWLLFVLCI